MKRVVLAAALGAALAAPLLAQGGPPPGPPLYIVRDALPAGDRQGAGRDGAALFSNRCGYCHLLGGMASNLLTKQRMVLGEPPEKGLLANRTDLTVSYVKAVVRGGKVAMPPLSRIEVTDAELDAIARHLGKAGE